jgi:hypothetical protein
MGRRASDPDYDLPPLTFAEAARILGMDEGVFMAWVMKTVKPSVSQWSDWTTGRRTIPERLVRLYLMVRRETETTYQADLQRLKETKDARDRELERRVAETTAAAYRRREKASRSTGKKRAAG